MDGWTSPRLEKLENIHQLFPAPEQSVSSWLQSNTSRNGPFIISDTTPSSISTHTACKGQRSYQHTLHHCLLGITSLHAHCVSMKVTLHFLMLNKIYFSNHIDDFFTSIFTNFNIRIIVGKCLLNIFLLLEFIIRSKSLVFLKNCCYLFVSMSMESLVSCQKYVCVLMKLSIIISFLKEILVL